ncbi:MAG: TauD/TfdA family dioxygenase [Planctomycetota bacterium]
MKVKAPAPGQIGAEVTDLRMQDLTPELAADLRGLVYEHRLVVVRHQEISRPEYVEVAKTLGRPQIYFQSHYHHPEHPEIFVSANVPEDGQKVGVAGTGRFWHSDYQFFDEPLSITMIYPQIRPEGRGTKYVDMVRVLHELPDHLRSRLEGTHAFHEATWFYKVQPEDMDKAIHEILREFREITPGASHPTIITHPVTGEQALYVSEGFTTAIHGFTHEENHEVLEELFEFIRREDHVHPHVWADGDVLLWDNRQLIHRSGGQLKGSPSVSYRIGVYDDLPFYTNTEKRGDVGPCWPIVPPN